MNIRAQQQPDRPQHDYTHEIDRDPAEADEDQLDEAIEETFPASDPISP